MEHYDFAVLKCDGTIAAARSVALPHPSAAWSRVAELAENVDEPGCRIRVTNGDGDVVVLVGIAAARRRWRGEAQKSDENAWSFNPGNTGVKRLA